MLIIGCDFHTRYQQIAMVDSTVSTGANLGGIADPQFVAQFLKQALEPSRLRASVALTVEITRVIGKVGPGITEKLHDKGPHLGSVTTESLLAESWATGCIPLTSDSSRNRSLSYKP